VRRATSEGGRSEDSGRKAGLTRRRALATLGALALLRSVPARAEEPRFFRIGTAGTAGTYFQLGGVIANVISSPAGSPNCQRSGSCGVPGLIAVAQATQGSVENVQLIGRGQLESALVQADVASWAFHGTGNFKGKPPFTSLRAIGALFPESVHIVALRDGPIAGLRDLKGRRVAIGEKESGTIVDARIVLEAAGIAERDIKADYSRLGEAANALHEGTLDAFFVVGGSPIPAIADLAQTAPIRLIPIGEDIADKLKKRYPFFSSAAIPESAYAGLAGETPTLALSALWVVAAEIADDLVYAMTKALWNESNQRIIAGRHQMGKRMTLAHALDGLDLPLHPGAERFYRETGILLADAQIPAATPPSR
jgi:TRAP transporter TAXI family solute receptor